MVAYRTLVLLYKLLKICLLFSMLLFLRAEYLRHHYRYFLNIYQYWHFLKTYQFSKQLKNVQIIINFLFRMYCVVIRFSLRLFCDQSFGKYVYMANLLSQRVTVGVLCSFSNLSSRTQLTKLPYLLSSFIFNISSRRSYIPNSLPNKSQMQRTIFRKFR